MPPKPKKPGSFTADDLDALLDQAGQGGPVAPESVVGSPLQQLGRESLGVVKQGALPTIGMVGMGLMTGGASLPVQIGAEALGAIGGTGANMALGIQEPSAGEAIFAGAIPPAIRGLARAAKGIVSHLPGSELMKHEIAAQEARLVADKIVASSTSKELFGAIEALTAREGTPAMIALPNLQKMAQSLATHEAKMGLPVPVLETHTPRILDQFGKPQLPVTTQTGVKVQATRIQNAEIKALTKGLLEKLKLNGGKLSFSDFQAELSRFGSRSGFQANVKKETQHAYQKLYAAAEADLDLAAAGAGVDSEAGTLLKAAQQSYNLERTGDEVATLINKHITPISGEVGAEQVDTRGMIKELAKHKRYQALPLDVRSEIDRTLILLNRLPRVPSGETTSMAIHAGMRGVIGGAAGFYSAGPMGGAIIGAGAIAAPMIVSRAVQTQPGRALLRYILMQTGGALDEQALALIGTFLNAQRTSGQTSTTIRGRQAPGLQPSQPSAEELFR